MGFFYNMAPTIFATIVLVALGCTASKEQDKSPATKQLDAGETPVIIDVELQGRYDRFQKFVEDFALQVDPRRLSALTSITIESPKDADGSIPKKVVGRCYQEKTTKSGSVIYKLRLVISPDAKTILGITDDSGEVLDQVLDFLFFHEMGHCLGGLKHTPADAPLASMPISIMDTYVPAPETIISLPWEALQSDYATYWRGVNK